MINFDDYANENKTEHNLKWPYILDHPYRILIIGVSGSGKTNALLNIINNQLDIEYVVILSNVCNFFIIITTYVVLFICSVHTL